MKTQKKRSRVFLALVPHRDARLQLSKNCAALFKENCAGAFYFPWVAPLASLSKALGREELKICARAVRQASGGKFICEKTAALPFCEKTLLFGLSPQPQTGGSLALCREALVSEKITELLLPVLGSLLLPAGDGDSCLSEMGTATFKLSFRAAAVANFFWRPLRAKNDGGEQGEIIGFKWKIGQLCWLPKTL